MGQGGVPWVSHFDNRDIAWNFGTCMGQGGVPLSNHLVATHSRVDGTGGHVYGDMGVPSRTKKFLKHYISVS